WSTRIVRKDSANPGRTGPKLDHEDAPGPPPCSITRGSPPPRSPASPSSYQAMVVPLISAVCRRSSLLALIRSVHPRLDLVAELEVAVHLQGAVGVVGRVDPAGVGVAPGSLEVGALGQRATAGGLEEVVDGVDRPL